MRLKSIIGGMYYFNNDVLSRPLFESVVVPEVTKAIQDWIKSAKSPGVLIGGLALSFYGKPRQTMDVDMLYLTNQNIPSDVPGFKRIRDHAFQHEVTHVEIEVLSSQVLNVPSGLVNQIIKTSVSSNGVSIASKSGLVALKLQRGHRQDQADIEQLIKTGGIDLAPFDSWLSDEQITMYNEIERDVSR